MPLLNAMRSECSPSAHSFFDLKQAMCRWKGTRVEASVKIAGSMLVVETTPFVVSLTLNKQTCTTEWFCQAATSRT